MRPAQLARAGVVSQYHFKGKNTVMFEWFKKKKKFSRIKFHEEEFIDDIEKSLWEIKEEYDLPTEEIIDTVQSKRQNFDYMHKVLEKKNK